MSEPGFGDVPGIIPSGGSPLGGEAVTINGTGFDASTTVTFGSVPATAVRVLSAFQLTAVTPPAEPGQVTVTVTRAGEPPLILVDVERPLIQPFAGRGRRAEFLIVGRRPSAGGRRQCAEQCGSLQQGSSEHVFQAGLNACTINAFALRTAERRTPNVERRTSNDGRHLPTARPRAARVAWWPARTRMPTRSAWARCRRRP